MYRGRIRLNTLWGKVMSPEEAAMLIKDGMSGFTRAGDAKAVTLALAERAEREPLHITLMTGASLGNDNDKVLTKAGALARRLPF
jgi:succinyl-CoA:acetate CoA-transferase